MDQQDAVDGGIRQRQRILIDEGCESRPRRGPFQHALRRRHEGDAALGVFPEQSEIGRGITDAEHALTVRTGPSRVDAAIDQFPRHDAEAPRIEVAQIDDIDAHIIILPFPPPAQRAEYCIAPAALTPYLWAKSHHRRDDGWRSYGRRDSRFHLPVRQFRLSDPRSRHQGNGFDRRAGGRSGR